MVLFVIAASYDLCTTLRAIIGIVSVLSIPTDLHCIPYFYLFNLLGSSFITGSLNFKPNQDIAGFRVKNALRLIQISEAAFILSAPDFAGSDGYPGAYGRQEHPLPLW